MTTHTTDVVISTVVILTNVRRNFALRRIRLSTFAFSLMTWPARSQLGPSGITFARSEPSCGQNAVRSSP